MGIKHSKQEESMINDFLLEYMPLFLEKRCRIQEGLYMDPLQFWIGFHCFLKAQKINVPSPIFRVNSDWLKYYFHQLDTSKCIYVTGAPKYNVLVGVSMLTWPGTYETDGRARREDEFAKI